MDFLLDTLIWFTLDVKELPQQTKEIIENTQNVCYVSIASFWEMTAKYSLGK